jgi:hypothetical protein
MLAQYWEQQTSSGQSQRCPLNRKAAPAALLRLITAENDSRVVDIYQGAPYR